MNPSKLASRPIFTYLNCTNAFQMIHFDKTRTKWLVGLFGRTEDLAQPLGTEVTACLPAGKRSYSTYSINDLQDSTI